MCYIPVLKYHHRTAGCRCLNLFSYMSKGNMLLGQARGKVGSLVFSRSNGQQVVRSRAEVVKNPKTTAQIIQRILLNTVSQSYSIMQPIVDHSFEGIQPGQKTMSKYMSENVKALRERVINAINAGTDLYTVYDFTPIGSSRFAPNVFVVSKGTLPEIVSTVVEDSTVYSAQVLVSGNTYQDVIDSLGLQRGDQLTFMQIVTPLGGGAAQFKYARVILDPVLDGDSAPLSTAFVADGAINAANPRNEGIIRSIEFTTDHLDIKLTAQNTEYIIAACVIASRKVNDTWKRSNASLALGPAVLTDAVSFGDAVTQSEGSIDAINSRYLNNAANGSLANFNSGGTVRVPRIVSVAVNGTTIAAGSTTSIAANAASTIIINTQNVNEAMYAAYKIGSGSWNSPVLISNNRASIANVNLQDGNEVSFAIGTGSSAASFSPTRTWSGKAAVVAPGLVSVNVDGTDIASTGNTNVLANAAAVIVMTTVQADGKYAAYRKNAGSWSNPVLVSGNAARFTGVALNENDTVNFAIGTGSTSVAFTPDSTWGGTAVVVGATISGVTVNGSAIASTGSSDVIENAASTIVISTVNGAGKYASYRKGSGSWATPVAVSDNQAQFSGVALNAADVVSFAIGNGSTSSNFTPTANWGGTANVIAAPAGEFSNVTFNGQSWQGDRQDSSLSTSATIAGNWSGNAPKVALVEAWSAPSPGDTYTEGSSSELCGVGNITNNAFSFNPSRGISGEESEVYMIAAAYDQGTGTLTVVAAYQYHINISGI